MIELVNKSMSAKINEMGAELRSLKKENEEYIWNGNPDVWSGTAPIMFPICGGLKDDKFIFEGKEYILAKHGFARKKLFKVESKTESSATFLLVDDDETFKSFPFHFEFRAIFTLTKNTLKIEYKVKNTNNKKMYFNVGSHEAYSTPEGVEDYDVIFPQNETLNATILDGNLLEKHTLPIIKDTNVLPIYDKHFIVDCLLFQDLKSRSAVLRNRKTAKTVKVEFPDADYFLLWHKYAAGYICLEPWGGIPDNQDTDYDITKKEGITELDAGKEYACMHKITV